MAAFDRVCSGIPQMDEQFDNIRLGDNVVWRVDSLEDFKLFAGPYVQQAIEDGRNLIYIRFASQFDVAGVEFVDKKEAFARADIITNHMNLTEENRHFFNEDAFAKMKRRPIFINVGRGGSVDEHALVNALNRGLIRGAGIDVLEEEDPDLSKCSLLRRKNVIITPHSAFYSQESIEKLQRISGANLGYFLAGKNEEITELVR